MRESKKVYYFKVRVDSGPYPLKEKAWTKVVILGSQKLTTLAKIIAKSFKFDFDTMYGFYSDLKMWTDSKEKYEEVDWFDEDDRNGAIEAYKIKVDRAFDQVGKKFQLIYNYADWWVFIVELTKVEEAKDFQKYPQVLEVHGVLPEYYFDSPEPDWEDDDCGICAFMKKSDELGKAPTVEEMSKVFAEQNRKNIIDSLKDKAIN